MANDFPAVTAVPVRDALDAVGHVVTNLVLGLRGATALTLLVALLVLGGALAAGHRNRVHDAVVLRCRAPAAAGFSAPMVENLLVGGATAVSGVAAGSAAAALVLTRVINLSFGWLPGPALGAAAAQSWPRYCSGCSAPLRRWGSAPRRCAEP